MCAWCPATMQLLRNRAAFLLVVLTSLLLAVSSAWALEPGAGGNDTTVEVSEPPEGSPEGTVRVVITKGDDREEQARVFGEAVLPHFRSAASRKASDAAR